MAQYFFSGGLYKETSLVGDKQKITQLIAENFSRKLILFCINLLFVKQ